MKEHKTFTFKNELSELNTLAERLESLGEEWELGSKAIFSINLALDEILTNIISYGFEDNASHSITIDFDLNAKDIDITIVDDGKPFNLLDVAEPDTSAPLEDRKIGGLGILFVKKFMDKVEYQRKDNYNIVKLKKILANI
jgi:anti-sigma regulatory factor (Ser/Thr protein kinase)